MFRAPLAKFHFFNSNSYRMGQFFAGAFKSCLTHKLCNERGFWLVGELPCGVKRRGCGGVTGQQVSDRIHLKILYR